jgi:uncharacterized DUF497 family protein
MYVQRDPTRFELGELRFTWDAAKYSRNVAVHGVTFEEAATTWLDPGAIERFDEEHAQEEDRWLRIGRSALRGALLVTWSAERVQGGVTSIRIIGARRATRGERNLYEQASI